MLAMLNEVQKSDGKWCSVRVGSKSCKSDQSCCVVIKGVVGLVSGLKEED
jgi:hypothetical protein